MCQLLSTHYLFPYLIQWNNRWCRLTVEFRNTLSYFPPMHLCYYCTHYWSYPCWDTASIWAIILFFCLLALSTKASCLLWSGQPLIKGVNFEPTCTFKDQRYLCVWSLCSFFLGRMQVEWHWYWSVVFWDAFCQIMWQKKNPHFCSSGTAAGPLPHQHIEWSFVIARAKRL